MSNFESAAKSYATIGVDVERAMKTASATAISMHCWQGDDVKGFDQPDGGAADGIQTTGNYPGAARTFDELTADFIKATSLIPGKKRINLHASYAIFGEGEWVDRDKLEYRHFETWVKWAKEHGFGIDFNPTCFGHPMVKDGMTLSSPDEKVRRFWIDHCKACRKIENEIGKAMGDKVLNNVWIPDGMKDIPADRLGPRARLKAALDEIFSEKYEWVVDSVESKVFGIGLESYTTGSNEFYVAYAASHKDVYPLLDSGHYHPTELISDKISSLLCFFERLPLHISRPVRWDSDHVVIFDDELREIFKELVRNDALERAMIGLDFFDASINRVAAWVIGTRAAQKALLFALTQPNDALKDMQDSADFTRRLMLMEDVKTLPFGEIWDEYCRRQNVPLDRKWYAEVEKYERDVQSKRK